MVITQTKIDELLELVEKKFPKWSGVSDPRFEEEEVHYKQAIVEKAKDLPNGLITSEVREGRLTREVRERAEPVHSFGGRAVGFAAAGSGGRFVRQVPEHAECLP